MSTLLSFIHAQILLPMLTSLIKLAIDQIYLAFRLIFQVEKIDQPEEHVSCSKINTHANSNMDTENIWFDGVNKRLLEVHTTDPRKLVQGNDKTLITTTPLTSFSSLSSSKKIKGCTSKAADTTDRKSTKASRRDKSIKDLTIRPHTGVTDELALDCEMVECYHHKSVLARVSIVNLFGYPILDRYVAPPGAVTDYRTRYSGIRPKDLADAPDFEVVQKEVNDLIKGRIVVGHAIHNDFTVLKINHPPELVRDTSQYFKFLFQGRPPSLKKLTESLLGIKIQKGEHDSVQDAQATMKLYVKERDKWNERQSSTKLPQIKNGQKQKVKPKKRKMKTFYVLTN